MRRALPILLTLLTGSMVLAQSVDRDEPLSAILARVGAACRVQLKHEMERILDAKKLREN